MKDKVYVGLLGLGTVGTGVYKVLKLQKDEMKNKLGCEVVIKKIMVRNLEKAAKKLDDPSVLTNDFNEILNDSEIDIVIEVMGGIESAKEYMLEAINAGKNVVTANKDVIAQYGRELLLAARDKQVDLYFEAAVAGGIPIIRPLKHCLAGNNIDEIMGIVNGTTNFILTKMTKEGMDYSEALAIATELGYAEADPTADVEGYDAGRKIAIMASLGFRTSVRFSDVYTEGITGITAEDIKYADNMGYVIKLLGMAKNTPSGIEVSVTPMLISKDHQMAAVNDSFNAVFVHGDAVDDAMFYGRGAGELPTASAVVGDVFEVTRNINNKCTGKDSCLGYKAIPIKKKEDIESKFFTRIFAEDRIGVLAAIASVFGANQVSIEQLIQKDKIGDKAEIVVMTASVKTQQFENAVKEIKALDSIHSVASIIRVHDS